VTECRAVQRMRLIDAALRTASQHGDGVAPVVGIVTRAGISRRTFYKLFRSSDDCLLAGIEDMFDRMDVAVAPICAAEGAWSERMRTAIISLLAFLERDRGVAAFMVSYLMGRVRAPEYLQPRARALRRLQDAVDEGRHLADATRPLSPLTAEFLVGGALAIVQTRLQDRRRPLTVLVNELMSMIMLPYLGPTAAAGELRRGDGARPVLLARTFGDERELEVQSAGTRDV
jgi:AcrR family transcriptional regulator